MTLTPSTLTALEAAAQATCHDCGNPETVIVLDDEDPSVGYRGEIALCVVCAVAHGLITHAEVSNYEEPAK